MAYPPGFTHLPADSFELLAAPPSPHGWRLQQTIGLGTVKAEVDSCETEGTRLVAARVAERAYRADAFVLATGHHIGGGIRGGRKPTEPLLELGVFHEGRPASVGGARLRHLEYLNAAEELRSGLQTDKRLRPMDEQGAVPYSPSLLERAGGYEYAGSCGSASHR